MFTVAELTHTSNGTTPTTHSEAPISLNCFVDVDGLGRVQATARGQNAREAANNLKSAVNALQAPPSRTAQVGALLAKGIDCAVHKGDMGLIDRLAKAAALVLSDAVQPGERAGLMTVRSQCEPMTWYDVEEGHCSCPDHTRHGHLCKHLLAVSMAARITI